MAIAFVSFVGQNIYIYTAVRLTVSKKCKKILCHLCGMVTNDKFGNSCRPTVDNRGLNAQGAIIILLVNLVNLGYSVNKCLLVMAQQLQNRLHLTEYDTVVSRIWRKRHTAKDTYGMDCLTGLMKRIPSLICD